MKKIVIVDGGPRKNMNTAQLLQRVAEGAMLAERWRSECVNTTSLLPRS